MIIYVVLNVNKMNLEGNSVKYLFLLLAFLRNAENRQGVSPNDVVSGQSLNRRELPHMFHFIVRQVRRRHVSHRMSNSPLNIKIIDPTIFRLS